MGNKPSIGGIDIPASGANGAAGGGSKEGGGGNKISRQKVVREKSRYGAVIVKVASLSSNRRQQERQSTFTITPRGGLFHGTQCNPTLVQKALQSTGYPCLPPAEISLGDSRAHKLLIIHSNGWYAIPAPETFSRHSGTCIILGDRNNAGLPFPIKLGDCFRLGSVGLVVSELRTADGDEQRLDSRMLQYLKDEALAFDTNDELAALAAEEGSMFQETQAAEASQMPGADRESKMGIANGERFICYMCYETHDTPEDPLVAPCECRGDTRYLHVQCLQKWYHSSVCGPQARVIRTTGNGAPACKICGTAYKTTFKKADGRISSLLEMESKGPYLSLVVVTRHDTNPGLFNTKFRLNFGRMPNSPLDDPNDPVSQPNALVIGRSSSCSMVLDYRTVSTVHAIIFYSDGQFFLQDRRSSNGTMVYLQEPLELPYSHPLRLRMGRSTLTIQAKRNWVSTMRGIFGTGRSGALQHPTPQELLQALSQSGVNGTSGGAPTAMGAATAGAGSTTSIGGGSVHGAEAGGGGAGRNGPSQQIPQISANASATMLPDLALHSPPTGVSNQDHILPHVGGGGGGGVSVPASGAIPRVDSRVSNLAGLADGQAALGRDYDQKESGDKKTTAATAAGTAPSGKGGGGGSSAKVPAVNESVTTPKKTSLRTKVSNRVAPEEAVVGAGGASGAAAASGKSNAIEDKKAAAAVQEYADTVVVPPPRGPAGGIVIGDGGAADIEGSAALKAAVANDQESAIDVDAPAAGQFAVPNTVRPHTPGGSSSSRPGSAALQASEKVSSGNKSSQKEKDHSPVKQAAQARLGSPVAPSSSSGSVSGSGTGAAGGPGGPPGNSSVLFSTVKTTKDKEKESSNPRVPAAAQAPAPTGKATAATAPIASKTNAATASATASATAPTVSKATAATAAASAPTVPSPGTAMSTKKVAPEEPNNSSNSSGGRGSRKSSSNAVTPIATNAVAGAGSSSDINRPTATTDTNRPTATTSATGAPNKQSGGEEDVVVKKPKKSSTASADAGGAGAVATVDYTVDYIDADDDDDAQTVTAENDGDGDQSARPTSRGSARKGKGKGDKGDTPVAAASVTTSSSSGVRTERAAGPRATAAVAAADKGSGTGTGAAEGKGQGEDDNNDDRDSKTRTRTAGAASSSSAPAAAAATSEAKAVAAPAAQGGKKDHKASKVSEAAVAGGEEEKVEEESHVQPARKRKEGGAGKSRVKEEHEQKQEQEQPDSSEDKRPHQQAPSRKDDDN